MTETARNLAGSRKIELHFVERKKARYDRLNEVLTDASDVDWKTYRGDVEDHLDNILGLADGVPFFGFLDPCGLGLTFDDLTSRIYERPYGNWSPGTEVLINFSADAVRRIGGRLREPAGAQGREATLDRMDGVCGDDWWRDIFLKAETDGEAAEAIAEEYFKRLVAATHAGGWVVPAKYAHHHQPKYSLIFLTRHRDGMVEFGNSLSLAQQDWRKALVQDDELLSDPVYFKAEEDALAHQWIKDIKKNITAELAQTSQFVLRTRYREVMGDTAGSARETHLRKAIKELYNEGGRIQRRDSRRDKNGSCDRSVGT